MPFSFIQVARVCIDRTFEVPQAAAGPLVTPTNPIFSVLSAPCEVVAVAATARMDAPQSTTLLMIFRLPIMRFLPGDRGRVGPIQSFVPIIELTAAFEDCQQSRLLLYTLPRDLRFRPLGLWSDVRTHERAIRQFRRLST